MTTRRYAGTLRLTETQWDGVLILEVIPEDKT